MHALWHWILYVLAWASHDPLSIAAERARAAGCVTVAYASLAQEPAREAEKPASPAACPCGGKGYTVRPDGSRWACKCGACSSGKCRKNLP
jgi:hypothetical protein